MEKFWGDYRWVGKSGVLEHKSGDISETRTDRTSDLNFFNFGALPFFKNYITLQIEKKVTMEEYRNLLTLFPTAPSPTPYGLPFPNIGVRTPPKNPIAITSGTDKATNFKLGQNNNRVHPNKSP